MIHDVPKTNVELLQRCAYFFRVLGQPLAASHVYEKLEDTSALADLYVECRQWELVSSVYASCHYVTFMLIHG